MLQENFIEFKGTKNGIYVLIKQLSDYNAVKEQLIERLEKNKAFFTGAQILDIQSELLTTSEKQQLETLMREKYQMEIIKKESHEIVISNGIFQGIQEGHTRFMEGTVRSGQKIDFDGNMVIIGDVNPGAEVVAHGNIVVMGSLRGTAHAGSNGNQNAYVVAYYLDPTQLRIADIIARAPDGFYEKPKGPEMARIRDLVVMIEPYLSRK